MAGVLRTSFRTRSGYVPFLPLHVGGGGGGVGDSSTNACSVERLFRFFPEKLTFLLPFIFSRLFSFVKVDYRPDMFPLLFTGRTQLKCFPQGAEQSIWSHFFENFSTYLSYMCII